MQCQTSTGQERDPSETYPFSKTAGLNSMESMFKVYRGLGIYENATQLSSADGIARASIDPGIQSSEREKPATSMKSSVEDCTEPVD